MYMQPASLGADNQAVVDVLYVMQVWLMLPLCPFSIRDCNMYGQCHVCGAFR